MEYPGAIYHAMNRGDCREPLFKDDRDRVRGTPWMPVAPWTTREAGRPFVRVVFEREEFRRFWLRSSNAEAADASGLESDPSNQVWAIAK